MPIRSMSKEEWQAAFVKGFDVDKARRLLASYWEHYESVSDNTKQVIEYNNTWWNIHAAGNCDRMFGCPYHTHKYKKVKGVTYELY